MTANPAPRSPGSGPPRGLSAAATEVRSTQADTQYVTVGVDREVFALDVACVREVIDPQPFTRLPNMPPSVCGMIDVRHQSVPVFDLRVTFGLSSGEQTEHTRIVVLEVPFGDRAAVLGALTDRVFEVTALDEADIEAPPELGGAWRSPAVAGLGRRKGHLVVVLDIAKVFSLTDLTMASADDIRL
ncbi:chemotaxis protein CheW [Roseospira marina]|uniref:Chemotaxis protein CheW n=1 Tax=Roseospira marina TaxID=140057 RepID=A0A5M6I8L9_9PROT|nr:chemotaxis protein CheW [Roseospira marina]KAA5604586.1 chemotaxis protein CheW [Roseospira marina]MBB4315336.1 purine-binding chemotaxis protein CheW [Roseospira marina]MBB5088335.1 purine-binding chemotaxis protein CheW [Roseospira marina]